MCVIGYNDTALDMSVWLSYVEEYLESAEDVPHNIRWCISLCYLLASKFKKTEYYKRCLEYDPFEFHVTILTNQLKACLELGETEYLQKGLELYDEALEENFKEVLGTENYRYTTGYREWAEITKLAYEIVTKLKG